MIEKVRLFLKEYNIKNKTAIVGFSCGADSCSLALILNELKDEFNLDLVLAYFNHGWRVEADEEEKFTIDFADKIKAKYEIKKAPKNFPKTEETARELRYSYFCDTAKKYNTDTVFLAHNKNDNIETLIYRIIKGTSTKGLTSIPPQRDIYYRPLLETEKKDILNFLKEKNQPYKFDCSNNDNKYKRNLIRNEILPYFEKINPNYINNINNLIKNAISTKNILDDVIEKTKKEIIKEDKINYKKFINLSRDLRLEILNDFLGDLLKYRDYKTISKFDDFILSNEQSKTSINQNLFLKIKNDSIFIEKKSKINNDEMLIDKEGEYVFNNNIIKIEKIKKTNSIYPKSEDDICYLDFDFPVVLRHRKVGDIFSPYGLKGKMKLKDYFINEKIEQNKKDELLLLCKNNEVIWVIGKKISENYKVKSPDCYKLIRKNTDG